MERTLACADANSVTWATTITGLQVVVGGFGATERTHTWAEASCGGPDEAQRKQLVMVVSEQHKGRLPVQRQALDLTQSFSSISWRQKTSCLPEQRLVVEA